VHKELVKEFIKFVSKELQLQSLPNGIKFASTGYAKNHLSFGTYLPSEDTITVVSEGRHLVDVMRTLAHELVHHKQREEGKTLDGSTGSDLENEANATAGILMRKFREIRPEMFNEVFNVGPWGFHTNMENNKVEKILSVAKTGQPEKIDEHYVDQYTARLLVTVMHKLSPENKQKFVNESIDKMVAVAYKIVTH
jgi:hypothetical protein